MPQLTAVSVQTTCIPPKETLVYTKQTQTTVSGPERDGETIYLFLFTFILS